MTTDGTAGEIADVLAEIRGLSDGTIPESERMARKRRLIDRIDPGFYDRPPFSRDRLTAELPQEDASPAPAPTSTSAQLEAAPLRLVDRPPPSVERVVAAVRAVPSDVQRRELVWSIKDLFYDVRDQLSDESSAVLDAAPRTRQALDDAVGHGNGLLAAGRQIGRVISAFSDAVRPGEEESTA